MRMSLLKGAVKWNEHICCIESEFIHTTLISLSLNDNSYFKASLYSLTVFHHLSILLGYFSFTIMGASNDDVISLPL